jgi:outer membrane receptor protein involved in Fe transport
VFKARAEWRLAPAWSAELGVVAVSDAPARGNENGLHRPDGRTYPGAGATAGHAVFDLGTAFQATPRLRVFAQVDNLFDRRYATASQLGTTGFDADGVFAPHDRVHSTFFAPGAPRTIRVGMRYTFD